MRFSDVEQNSELGYQTLTSEQHLANCNICYRYRNAAKLYCVLDLFMNILYLYVFSDSIYYIILLVNILGYIGTKYYYKKVTGIYILYLVFNTLIKGVFSTYYMIDNYQYLIQKHTLFPFITINLFGILLYVIIIKIFMKFYITLTNDVIVTLKNNNGNINLDNHYTIIYW